MGKYDFDTVLDRRHTNSMKWNVGENELPMWVADMDFPTAPPVRRAIKRGAAHGVFGYAEVPDEWFDAYLTWWRERHGFSMEKEWLIFCTGVVPAISSLVRKLTTPAEKVLIQTPVYNIFFNSIVNNGRVVLESPLVRDGDGYRMDFARLERDLSDPQTTLFILCNPHNPVGKIWDRETLARVGELCQRHHVTVISDEIHCDLTLPGRDYVPFASASDVCRRISVTCIAPTKAFNLAGLQTAAVCVPEEGLRARVRRALNTDEVAEPNVFAGMAAVEAFTKGAEWLDELRAYLAENRRAAEQFIGENLPKVGVTKADATYLLWLDCASLLRKGDTGIELAAWIRKSTGLYLSDGVEYGKGGETFLRMNLACPRETLEDGLTRLLRGIRSYEWSR